MKVPGAVAERLGSAGACEDEKRSATATAEEDKSGGCPVVPPEDALCRFCMEGAGCAGGGSLIAPCGCTGSQRWVHRGCLQEWQATVVFEPNSARAQRCSICTMPYSCGLLASPDQVKHARNLSTCRLLWQRFTTCGLFLVALTLALFCARLIAPTAPDVPGLGAGTVLVSHYIGAGIFRQSVVLMVDHSCRGALGYILNKPSSQLGVRSQALAGETDGSEFRIGGPVAHRMSTADLYDVAPPRKAQAVEVVQGVWWSQTARSIDEDLQPRLRFYGYAGWGPRQLESEFRRGAWRLLNATEEIVFDLEPATLWVRLSRIIDEQEVVAVEEKTDSVANSVLLTDANSEALDETASVM